MTSLFEIHDNEDKCHVMTGYPETVNSNRTEKGFAENRQELPEKFIVTKDSQIQAVERNMLTNPGYNVASRIRRCEMKKMFCIFYAYKT